MRINQFVARASGLSRRVADKAIEQQHVRINGQLPSPSAQVGSDDIVTLDGKTLTLPEQTITIMLNKPVGYVCSRAGQGSRTIYELLPAEYQSLKPVGRLDKDSSGLLLLTNDGQLANQLTHPSFKKVKVYEVALSKPLKHADADKITRLGVKLADGMSKLELQSLDKAGQNWQITMYEGRNRQIRRTFVSLGYQITNLHRTHFGEYKLESLKSGELLKI